MSLMKPRKTKKELVEKEDSSASTSELKSKNIFLFIFISSSVSFGVRTYIHCFFDLVRNQGSDGNYILELIKKRLKGH